MGVHGLYSKYLRGRRRALVLVRIVRPQPVLHPEADDQVQDKTNDRRQHDPRDEEDDEETKSIYTHNYPTIHKRLVPRA